MSIRVAYDISFQGRFFDRPHEQNGIFRVIEELLYALARRDDIALTAVGLCGDHPLADSVRSLLYVQRRSQELLGCDFRHTFRSRLGLTRLYAGVFTAAEALGLDHLPRHSLRALWIRYWRALLYRLAYTYRIDDLRHALDPGAFDVFHSPFLRLPPRELTGSLPRVLTVYDLIFLRPHFMPAELISYLRRILDSVDIERDWVTCISEFTKQEFCEHTGMSPERVFVAPLAAARHFRPVMDADVIAAARCRYGIPDGNYFLGLGVLQPRKNLAHLIRCFFRLLAEQKLPDMHLVLAGAEGWMYDEIFAEVAGSRPEHRARVVFAGYLADEDLAALYSGATAFVYPSLYEGFGLPPLEAMQCGTPVITSNTTALPEVVGGAGLLVDPHDADALCQALLEVAQDEGLRRELSERGLKRARQFSWAKCAVETVKAYEAAASDRPR